MNRIVIALLTLFIAASILLAQSAPQLSEIQRLKLLNSYQHAILAQQQKDAANQQFDSARDAYTKLADDIAGELKLPKGSNFIIDIPGQKVEVKLPPPEPPKPAPAPPEVKK